MNVVGLFVLYTTKISSSDLSTMTTSGTQPSIVALCCSYPNLEGCSAYPDVWTPASTIAVDHHEIRPKPLLQRRHTG